MSKELLEMAAVGAVMQMIGITSEAEGEAFNAHAADIGKRLAGLALNIATDTVEGDEEATANLYDIAVASFAMDKASEFLKTKLQEVIMKQAVADMMNGMIAAAGDED